MSIGARSHLLGIADLSAGEITSLLDAAEAIADGTRPPPSLAGRVQVNTFFENSTRTLLSFELAGKRLGMHVLNMAVAQSSVAKGETLADTGRTLAALGADIIVMRHSQAGAAAELAAAVPCAVVNGGDGTNEHPTQALIDALVLRRRFDKLEGLTVAICGDIRHSRVARSNMLLLTRMGAAVRVSGPALLMPEGALPEGAQIVVDLDDALSGVDAVMMLRVQHERMADRLDLGPDAYYRSFGLTPVRLARAASHALVLHPGPINRGVEIDSAIADDPARSVILEQVALGVPVRMACLAALARP